MRIKELEQMIRKNVSAVKSSFNGNSAAAEAQGAKLTAHSAMVEIKKLLIEAADTLHKLPIDEAYDTVRKETELKCAERVQNAIHFCERVFGEMEKKETELKCAERVQNAIQFCERVFGEMEKCEAEGKECDEFFELPKGAEPNGIEYIILKLHERWRTKHHQLLESETFLENQQQICRELESRLSDAQEKLAEFESRRSSESDRPRSRSPLSPNAQDFWNRILESFSQSCRATEAMDMRLSSTNALIKNALEQLDTSSNTANSAVASTKIQFAILAARLTAKQADNDALFRATSELANTNVALQNQVDELQEKLAQVEDVQVESETKLKKLEQHENVGGVIAEKSKTTANAEATVPSVVKPKKVVTESKPLTVNIESEQSIVAEKVENAAAVVPSTKTIPKKTIKIVAQKEKSPTVTVPKKPEVSPKPAPVEDDWGWNDDTQEESSYATAVTNLPLSKSNDKKVSPNAVEKKEESSWGAWDEDGQQQNDSNDWGAWDDEPARPVKKVEKRSEASRTEKKSPKLEEKKDDWGWGESEEQEESPVVESKKKVENKKQEKPASNVIKQSKPSPSADWAWDESEDQDSSAAKPKAKSKSKKHEETKVEDDDWGW
uniref:Uncharacterized protein n=2 Tax=Panagrolaimus sp. JU765 TaxID=591449 RepID=A0AC34RC43_9BILA